MTGAGEFLVIGGIFAMVILGICIAVGAYDQSTDPSTDPHAGDQFDDGVQPYDYEAHNQAPPSKPHNDVDLGPSSNPQVEAG